MKKRVRDVQKKFSLDEIDELGFMVVISKPEFEKQIISRISNFGGRVFFSKKAEGVSKYKKIEMLGIQPEQSVVIFATARKEDSTNILVALDSEFNFSSPGCGLGLVVDVEGYMGAKGLFVK